MVGELVKGARERRGLTQTELAELTGLRQTYISQVESGEISLPRDHNLDKLGRPLGLARADFYRAAGMFDGLPDAPSPVLYADNEEGEEISDEEIIAYVKARPGRFFQRDIAALERDLSPADFLEQCRDIFAAWKSNSRLAVRSARRGR